MMDIGLAGSGIADPPETDVAKKFTALQSQITSNAATPSQVAALAAYSDVQAIPKRLLIWHALQDWNRQVF